MNRDGSKLVGSYVDKRTIRESIWTQLNSAHLAEGRVCYFARPGKPTQFPQPEKPLILIHAFPGRENRTLTN